MMEGAEIHAYDPQAMDKARKELPTVTYCNDLYDAAAGADAIVLLTEWSEFKTADFKRLAGLVERRLIIDGRNALAKDEVASHGFQYLGIGNVAQSPAMVASLANV
jgi:UDPglucose 6-dehydrogenase